MQQKIVKLTEIEERLSELKKAGKRIVHCHGCFDLIHHGHIKHFEAAKKFGDVLVVTVTEDKYVNKGPDRPFFNQHIRAENLSALEVVDFVAVNFASTAIPAIEKICPDFYVKGQDYKVSEQDVTGGILVEKQAVESVGGKLVFTEEVQFSSSNLINQFFDEKGEDAKHFLKQIKKKYNFSHFEKLFEQISKKKVLIVGDIILDEYQFVKPIGKASKSPTITSIRGKSEVYAGGVLAVANHVADFVDEVILVTTYGKNRDREYWDLIQENLHEKVKLITVKTSNHPTVLKSRIVDEVFKHKLFEVIEINDQPLNDQVEQELIKEIEKLDQSVDISLIADFGHGVLTPKLIEKLQDSPSFLAVNAQTNSANLGYNLLTKYKKCDYFSIDKGEAHLALHKKFDDISMIHHELNKMTAAKVSSITLGINGTSVMGANGNQVTAPIFNTDVVDTIGAGDAYLSITSLLAESGASIEEIAFVGNAVGAMAVKIMGNKSYIRRVDLLKYLKTLLA
ncbi:MAG: cytidyltransferase [Flavobacteriales bacterium]|nr:cytidyltransferase [Flavobacteriales bacterium]